MWQQEALKILEKYRVSRKQQILRLRYCNTNFMFVCFANVAFSAVATFLPARRRAKW